MQDDWKAKWYQDVKEFKITQITWILLHQNQVKIDSLLPPFVLIFINNKTHDLIDAIAKDSLKDSRKCKSTRGNRSDAVWTSEEKSVLMKAFHTHVKGATLPGKIECQKLMSKEEVLKDCQWSSLKDWVRNYEEKIRRTSGNTYFVRV